MVVASGPVFRSRLGCISSRTDEATWHVHITLALTCELNSVYVAPGSDVSLTTGHMTKISAHSLLSKIFGTASALLKIFITTRNSLIHETSLSSKFVHPFLQSD